MILAPIFTFLLKEVEKTCIFIQKFLPLMTSYLVTIETDHHRKMRARDKRTATENFRG